MEQYRISIPFALGVRPLPQINLYNETLFLLLLLNSTASLMNNQQHIRQRIATVKTIHYFPPYYAETFRNSNESRKFKISQKHNSIRRERMNILVVEPHHRSMTYGRVLTID